MIWFYRLLAIICIGTLLLAIPPIWPYAYYQFLRVFIFIVAGIIAIKASDLEKSNWMLAMGSIAALFNPFFPIYLKKEAWVIIDFITALIFSGSIFIFKSKPVKQ